MGKQVWRYKIGAKTMDANGRQITASCNVRNELNGLRQLNQVVNTIPGGIPYMPRTFPRGTWKVISAEPRTAPDRAPYFIATDAYRMVDEWRLDDAGKYHNVTGQKVRDEGYGLHCSVHNTTLGCIKIHVLDDLLWMVEQIKAGHEIWLEVE